MSQFKILEFVFLFQSWIKLVGNYITSRDCGRHSQYNTNICFKKSLYSIFCEKFIYFLRDGVVYKNDVLYVYVVLWTNKSLTIHERKAQTICQSLLLDFALPYWDSKPTTMWFNHCRRKLSEYATNGATLPLIIQLHFMNEILLKQ